MKDYISEYPAEKFRNFKKIPYKSDKRLIIGEYAEAIIVPFEFKFKNDK